MEKPCVFCRWRIGLVRSGLGGNGGRAGIGAWAGRGGWGGLRTCVFIHKNVRGIRMECSQELFAEKKISISPEVLGRSLILSLKYLMFPERNPANLREKWIYHVTLRRGLWLALTQSQLEISVLRSPGRISWFLAQLDTSTWVCCDFVLLTGSYPVVPCSSSEVLHPLEETEKRVQY